jgi:hypothetical protein
VCVCVCKCVCVCNVILWRVQVTIIATKMQEYGACIIKIMSVRNTKCSLLPRNAPNANLLLTTMHRTYIFM